MFMLVCCLFWCLCFCSIVQYFFPAFDVVYVLAILGHFCQKLSPDVLVEVVVILWCICLFKEYFIIFFLYCELIIFAFHFPIPSHKCSITLICVEIFSVHPMLRLIEFDLLPVFHHG